MATLKAKETGGSDSSNLTSSLPNDTDFSVNWGAFGAHGSPTRDNAQIESNGATSSVTLNIGSLSLTDVEIRVTGLDFKNAPDAGDALRLYFSDVNTGTLSGYYAVIDPNRATAAEKFKIQRIDSGSGTDLDNSVQSGWSATSGETVDFYFRFDGSTVTARAVQSAQSLDETLSAADTTYDFGTGASQIDHVYFSFRDTLLVAATFEVWDMSGGGSLTTILKGGNNIVLNSSGDIVGV